MRPIKPILFVCTGQELLPDEQAFFSQYNPLGLILLGRNCHSPEQIKKLIADFRRSVERDNAPIFIDQEGGRVARLRGPLWPSLPPMRLIGAAYEKNPEAGRRAAKIQSRLTASYLYDLGITGNFAPVLDLYIEGASVAIGDRAISADPDIVAEVGRIFIDTFLSNGVMPVIKHMPGHGRVLVDPHYQLPVVKDSMRVLEDDFKPFCTLNDAPMGMNCHVVFKAIDAHTPVSLSPGAHREIIRNKIGFKGIIFSDDLAMGAINRPCEESAMSALIAGADILLYCGSELDKMRRVATAIPAMSPSLEGRWKAAMKRCGTPAKSIIAEKLIGELFEILDYSPL
jgi:beta-N-acetylhexosaminidase